ncbi:helix-turn-helix domain-containing protein [Acidaminobacter sp. JC074]|uniref:helix-turn-helix transcriptional regulator n=1 Tax=Acidaminobacter sp. JC074 TaxID=2530199 RepID=UPI001F0E828D
MAYTYELEAILSYVEKRVKEKIDFTDLEGTLNYSYRHIRGFFKQETGISLSKYILTRKIAYCAKEIKETDRSLLDIAYAYNLGSYDTFTRAFKRETGIRPSDFKDSLFEIGIKHICMGIYAPSIIFKGKPTSGLDIKMSDQKHDACILYGVSRVYYGRKSDGFLQFTPFPMCLQSILDYLGQRTYYSHIMAATGASFRLTWNKDIWDLRAVDERNIFDDPYKSFKMAFEIVGRDFKIIDKESGSKEDFIKMIRSSIDKGYPLIALGLVGPPDATVITGYKDNGQTLYGWSLVQEHLEFRKDIKVDSSGYFECDKWWENTAALMSIGDRHSVGFTVKKMFENALEILTSEELLINERGSFYRGQAAYFAIIESLSDEKAFYDGMPYADLTRKVLAFRDAISMIWDGRSYGAGYIGWLGKVHLEISVECDRCKDHLRQVVQSCIKINELLGGLSGEKVALNLKKSSVRKTLITYLEIARKNELEASRWIMKIIEKL